MEKYKLLELIDHIDPSLLSYQEWINVGMALKHEGYTANVWNSWSSKDTKRFRSGECFTKWDGFLGGSSSPVTGGTIVQLARDLGWSPARSDDDHALDWDAVIGEKDDMVVIDRNWIEDREVQGPTDWDPVKEITTYLSILFEAAETVGYVTSTWQNDKGKYLPTKGAFDRTAGELIELLSKCNGDITNVFGDFNPDAGAWIRFNPLDGKGVKNENVTEYRYALVESDNMEIDKQNAILRELELPIACLVHSGGKSLHAIVRVDAADYDEYRKRVDYLYKVCQKNGLDIDQQNRNPSRLSRMPGVLRKGQKQFLVDTKIGKANWAEWYEWIEGVNDDLPEPEPLTSVWDNLPELSQPLIDGVLRQGHKMLLAGPSKAGKSYLLIEMCLAIAEGRDWLGWSCSKGRVLYVNLELDRASALHRFKDVYQALGWRPDNIDNIDIWNLRGKSVPMDKLAPKLIRRAGKKNYIAVVIDPIYKVITGDENSADQMAHFCNQFDKVCTELGVAVIYCHHHSKGYQGGKRSMDRASGSGVFARDPDALLDLTELELTEALIKQQKNAAECQVAVDYLQKYEPKFYDTDISQDDICSATSMYRHCQSKLTANQFAEYSALLEQARKDVDLQSAWRIEGTLREFPKFNPVDVWFKYPIHTVDTNDVLKDVEPEGEKAPWQKAKDTQKTPAEKAEERKNALEIAFSSLELDSDEPISVDDLAEEMGVTKRTVWNRIKEHKGFKTEKSDDKKSYVSRK